MWWSGAGAGPRPGPDRNAGTPERRGRGDAGTPGMPGSLRNREPGTVPTTLNQSSYG
jgi:hypothetical protein